MLNNFKEFLQRLRNYGPNICIFRLSLPSDNYREKASLAQLVEQLTRNEQVVGSSPMGGSIKKTRT